NLRAASNIAHARQLADGNSGSSSVSMEGQTVTMVSGYPTANAAGILVAAEVSSDYSTSDSTPQGGITTLKFDLTPSRTNCYAEYQAADGVTNLSAVVTVETSGCN
ncbi:MAG: mannose-sensitive hemagglutinin a, partial [Oceanobacter sp.]